MGSNFGSALYPSKTMCFVLNVLVFMLINCGVILNRKALEGYVWRMTTIVYSIRSLAFVRFVLSKFRLTLKDLIP